MKGVVDLSVGSSGRRCGKADAIDAVDEETDATVFALAGGFDEADGALGEREKLLFWDEDDLSTCEESCG